MLEDIRNERLKKLEQLKESGIEPYPAKIPSRTSADELLADFSKLSKKGKAVSMAGRVRAWRDQGKLIFADIEDDTGRIQAVLKKGETKDFKIFKQTTDIGDFIWIKGKLFKTKRGEKSIDVGRAMMIAKSLLPLPSEWYGVEEEELRLRKRYLEILLDPETKEMFRKKAIFWSVFRDFLKNEDFLEVEMPVLEAIPGGADAEPFVTHMNALDTDFYLRIALELPLKKLLVAGYERVFEIGRVFRNEGISREHLQDYIQLEFYWAYHDYNDLMKLTEKMYKKAVKATCGSLTTTYQGKTINWGKKWPVIDYVKVFKKENGIDPLKASREELFEYAKKSGFQPDSNLGKGRLIDLIYKKTVRPKLVQPSFLIDPPAELVPLAKRHRDDKRKVERMQIVACGTELGNGFTELNNPIDQRERFEDQAKLRAKGDTEAQQLDEEYLEAMEYGMPPAAGFGFSERLFSILMDRPIRETIFFPPMRPKKD